ncbi:MAG: ion transporter [Bacteroidetes bacterium]|nr:ion transporter [Bacteroidota bacterium]
MEDKEAMSKWKRKIHEVIFEADTPAGKAFDIALLWAIILSVVAVMLDSVKSIETYCGAFLRTLEWVFTIIFTIEYIARIISTGKPLRYIFSFFGLIDLLSIVPTYMSFFISGTQSLLVIRTLRLLRVFRILKLARYIGETQHLVRALKLSRPKIVVFLLSVVSIVIIMGTIMYLIEGQENGFTSIPRSIYWAIVTLTTVGYGDISPQTVLGQTMASFIMIMGYGLIAVPTGIVTTELVKIDKRNFTTAACLQCSEEGHDNDAKYCKFCGAKL